MSVYLSDFRVRVQRLSVTCDACNKMGTDPFDLPQDVRARLVPEQSIGMGGEPMYAIEGTPSVEEAEASFVNRGWTVRGIGPRRFIFCPNCKDRA